MKTEKIKMKKWNRITLKEMNDAIAKWTLNENSNKVTQSSKKTKWKYI